MGQPYVGEIRMFGGNFAPAGWMFCSGQLIPISENDTLFNLIGTTYGGDGQSTFALPNLQSRVPIHQGKGNTGIDYAMGETGGVESVTLTTQQIPAHPHAVLVASTNQTLSPKESYFATVTSSQAGVNVYAPGNPDTNLVPASILPAGGNQPHSNIQPYLAISFIISLYGVYPTQN